MKKTLIYRIITVGLCALLLAGCAGNPAAGQEPVPPEVPQNSTAPKTAAVKNEVIARPVDFSTLKDNDRIFLMSPVKNRVVSTVTYLSYINGLAVHLTNENMTSVPEASSILVYENAPDGAFRLRGEKGYLTTSPNGLTLQFKDRDEYSLWKAMSDGTLVNCNAVPVNPEDQAFPMAMTYYDDKNIFQVLTLYEDSLGDAQIRPFPIEEGFEFPKDDGKGYRLPVFETSDIHGHIVYNPGAENIYRLADIASRVNDSRSRLGTPRDDIAVLLDGGDIYQGTTLSELTHGAPMLEAFHDMRYDAVTLGNHEFDWDIHTLADDDQTMADYTTAEGTIANTIPITFCNLYQNGVRVPFTKDYVILEKTAVDEAGNELPVRIGVIGYSDDFSHTVEAIKFSGLGYSIKDDPAVLTELSRKLKEQENCDVVILLFHTDGEIVSERIPPEAKIDLVLAGHIHKNDVGSNSNGVPYVVPAGNSDSYCYGELVFTKDAGGKPVYEKTAFLRPAAYDKSPKEYFDGIHQSGQDPEIIAVSDRALEAIGDLLAAKIGFITVPVIRHTYYSGSGNRSSSGANFYCDLIRKSVDADVGFFNRYGMRADLTIPVGSDSRTITVSDIYDLFPFGNILCKFRLSYEEFLEVLKYALTDAGANNLTVMSGVDVYFVDRDVDAIVKDGVPLYAHGKWNIDEKAETLLVSVPQYNATRNAPPGSLENPFVAWMETDRLLENAVVDRDGAIRVLKETADSQNGLIPVDTGSHFINQPYPN